MGLETGTFLTDLVTTNPLSTDLRSQGDDHIRLIKSVLQATFPTASKAFYNPTSLAKTANYTVLASNMGCIFTCNATGGAFALTLPTLLAADAGWGITVVKTDASANAVTLTATINGEANPTLTKQYQAVQIIWSGTAWFSFHAMRVIAGVPTLTSLAVLTTCDITGAATVGGTLGVTGILTESATSHGLIARGTTAQRSGTTAGQFRFNSDLAIIEWYNGTAWVQAQSAPPVAGGFKNLSIKTATNTTVAVVADFVTMTDGTLYQTLAISGTINLGTNGAVNRLDTGVIAIDTWYYIWAIAKADGTAGALASASATAPTMPTGYTFKARIGAVQTIHASAILYGTWQFGRRAQYVVGLLNTTTSVLMLGGSSGNVTTPTWTAIATTRFVPTTASAIFLHAKSDTASLIAAPNNSYGGNGSATNPPPLHLATISAPNGGASNFLLESANIYYAANGSSAQLYCTGWEDNI